MTNLAKELTNDSSTIDEDVQDIFDFESRIAKVGFYLLIFYFYYFVFSIVLLDK